MGLVLLFPSIAIGDIAKDGNGVRLVKVMQTDRLMLLGQRLAYLQSRNNISDVLESNEDSLFYGCIESISPDIFTNLIAEELSRKLTSGEMRSALIFYKGPLGKKLVLRDSLLIQKMFVLRSGDHLTVAELASDERAKLKRFLQTSAGKKLLVQKIPFSDVLLHHLMLKFQEVVAFCATGNRTQVE